MQYKKINLTKEDCLLLSKNYETRKVFREKCPLAYHKSLKNGWIDEVCVHMKRPKNYRYKWTKEKCIEAAKKCKTRTEFNFKYNGAYDVAYNNSWLNEICNHMISLQKPSGYWHIFINCKREASKYKTQKEFRDNNGSAYNGARKNGWLDEITNHMQKCGDDHKKLRLIYAFEFPDKSIYIGLTYNSKYRKDIHLSTSSQKNSSAVLEHIKKTGLQPIHFELTDYIDVNSAMIKEGEFVEEYRNKGYKILNKSKTGGLGGHTLVWTKEKCIEEVKKYRFRSEFYKGSPSAYNSALQNGWLEEICQSLISSKKPNGYWTKEKCIELAKRYRNNRDFRVNNSDAYSAAHNKGWIKDINDLVFPYGNRLRYSEVNT